MKYIIFLMGKNFISSLFLPSDLFWLSHCKFGSYLNIVINISALDNVRILFSLVHFPLTCIFRTA